MPDPLSFCDGWAGNDPARSPAELLSAPISFYFTIYALMEIWLCITGHSVTQYSGACSVYGLTLFKRSALTFLKAVWTCLQAGKKSYQEVVSTAPEFPWSQNHRWSRKIGQLKKETIVKYHRTDCYLTEMLLSGERGTLIRGEHFRTFLQCSTTSGCVKLGQGNMYQ